MHHNLREQFSKAVLTGGKRNAEFPLDRDLVRFNRNPLELSLRGRRIGEIVALGHPPEEMVLPLDGDDDYDDYDNEDEDGVEDENAGDEDEEQDGKITISTVFYRMFDPMVHTGSGSSKESTTLMSGLILPSVSSKTNRG